jgi:glycosidase
MDSFKAMHDAWQVGGIAGVLTLVLNDYEECLPGAVPPAFFARYTDNHDEGRGLYRFGPGAVRAMNTLIFLTRAGLPFLLTGEEFGAVNRPSIHERIGPCDKGYRMLRPDQSVAQREGVEFEGNLFARGFENRQQWYTLFKDLIHLRKKNRALVYGSFELMDLGEQAAPEQCSIIAFERKYRGTRLRCAVNMGPEDRTLSNPELLAGEPLFGALRENILPSYSGVVVRVG